MKTILALALTLAAATASAKSFLIEHIDVNAAKRIPAAAVLTETRLDAGKTYTEEQIEQAVNRVRRLPFVIYAEGQLQPGSTPDARVLRINIEEAANFNWNLDLTAVGRPNYGGGSIVHGGAGYRFFPGRSDTLDALVAGTNEAFLPGTATVRSATLAYNRYGLLGTRAYGGVAVGTIFRTNSRHDVNPSMLLGLPLTRTQSVELTASRVTSRLEQGVSGIADPISSFYRTTDVAMTWLLQTTDDPYYARRGLDVSVGPSWEHVDLDIPFVLTFPKPPHLQPDKQKQHLYALNASAAKYWPLLDASAAWVRFDGFSRHLNQVVNGSAIPSGQWNTTQLLAGVAHDFNHDLGGNDQVRWRFELGVGYHYEKIHQRGSSQPNSGTEVEIGTAYRSRLALVHIALGYVAR